MSEDNWKIANSVAVSAAGFFAYRLCAALVARKVLEEDAAVDLLTMTAQDVRSSTVHGDAEALGDAVAKSYEQCAAWLLGHLGRLS
jgi:threonine dehydratase